MDRTMDRTIEPGNAPLRDIIIIIIIIIYYYY